jgi:xylitol oxidase
VQVIVRGAEKVRALGTRHTFNAIADSTELISLAGLPAHVVVDRDAGTVSCSAGMSFGSLADVLRTEGLALRNLPSLGQVSVAGAVSTGTHGSGDGIGNLATQVAALDLVAHDGELVHSSRGDPDFDGMVVGLGALGAVVRLTLDVEPTYEVRQRVFEGLEWATLFDRFDEITSAGYSVSIFTRWGPTVDMVWVKTRVTDTPEPVSPNFFGAIASIVDRHPLSGMDPVNCTPQLGRPGVWSERLPHFRMGFIPSSGDELQSEYLLPRQHAVAGVEAMLALASKIGPLLLVCELRTIAADWLWMSPEYGRDTLAIHFTWQPHQPAVEAVLVEVESALAPFGARPHWGKLFVGEAAAIGPLYQRLPDFRRLVERRDPRGVFRNAWLERHVLGGGATSR